DVVAARQSPLEPGEVRRPQPVLRRPVQHVHVLVGRRDAVGELAGAVRAGVVDDEQLDLRHSRAQPPYELDQVVAFVVGGADDENPAGGGSGAHWRTTTGGSGSTATTLGGSRLRRVHSAATRR